MTIYREMAESYFQIQTLPRASVSYTHLDVYKRQVCMLTIFTFAISVILMVLDAMAIVLSGLIGISAVIRSCDNKAISARETFFYGILQFVFCADVITSIIVFRKSKKKVKVNV